MKTKFLEYHDSDNVVINGDCIGNSFYTANGILKNDELIVIGNETAIELIVEFSPPNHFYKGVFIITRIGTLFDFNITKLSETTFGGASLTIKTEGDKIKLTNNLNTDMEYRFRKL